jgi:hypothetical protein
MSIQSDSSRSRRNVLVAGVAAVVGLAGHAIGREAPVRAGVGSVQLGETNTSANTTSIQNTTDASTVMRLNNSASGVGLEASGEHLPGIIASSVNGPGIQAVNHARNLLVIAATGNYGVYAAGQAAGVRAVSADRTGVFGSSGPGAPAPSTLRVGVEGWSTNTSFGPSYGVIGRSTAPLGIGVLGKSDTGTGVLATSQSGYGLSVLGRVSFETSGVGQINSGNSSADIDPGVQVADSTRILVTLHGDPGGSTVLQRVSKNTTADTFTVHLTAPTNANVKFSWFVFG